MVRVSVFSPCGARTLIGAVAALFVLASAALAPQAASQTSGTASPAAPQVPASAAPQEPAASAAPAAAEEPASPPVPIIYLSKQYEEPLPLSYAEEIYTDKGIQGARLMINEANQAGAFVGHTFELTEAIIPADGDIVAKAKEVLKNGDAFIIADLEAPDLLAVADLPEAKNSVLMNIRANDTVLRQQECRQNVFHIIPDWAMRADAIAQYLIWKKWPRWFVLRRDTPQDQDFFAMVERSAKRYGGKVVEDRVYRLPPGARNLDSGHQQVQTQVPMETQGAPEHDAVWVINVEDDFGDYLMYRTDQPRPVVGTQGLQAVAWDKSYTESGGMHLQNAIPKLANRKATERDYTGWLGVRSLTDSVMRTGKTGVADVKDYLLSEEFKLEGFKGMPLSFRDWDHQMRQPIILGGGTRVPVTTSPQEGFLHQTNVTDTLGFDRPETQCVFR